jgi:hypothetical protein
MLPPSGLRVRVPRRPMSAIHAWAQLFGQPVMLMRSVPIAFQYFSSVASAS